MELPSLSSNPREIQPGVECMSISTLILNAEHLTGLEL